MNFKEPISIFAYNLISLHHDVMWYVIIILTLVYWVLFKIIKEFNWSSFNKQEGFILYTYCKTFIKIQTYLIYILLYIFFYLIKIFNFIFLLLVKGLMIAW